VLGQRVEQRLLAAGQVVVDGHRLHLERLAQAAHGQPAQSLGVGDVEGGFDDPLAFRDHYTSDDIRLNRIEVVEKLGDRIPSPPNPVALAVLMERTASEYIWRAEATMGAGMSATEILDLETMVQDIDGQFEVLRQRFPQDLGLRQAYSRYQFIRGSLLNYNSDTVPYLVDRYSSDITDLLSRMERTKS
jgi:hypothetical protein